MKFVALSLPCLLSLAATCVLYGWLESTANMVEGLRLLFAPGATTVVFAPFLLLFIALALIIFVAGPMFAAAIGAILGGLLLRWRALYNSVFCFRFRCLPHHLDRASDPLRRSLPPWPSPRTSQGPAVCVGMRGRRQCRLELIVCGADHSQTDHQRKVAVLQRR